MLLLEVQQKTAVKNTLYPRKGKCKIEILVNGLSVLVRLSFSGART